MAVSATTLNGVTLPAPASYAVDGEFVGGAVLLADGSVRMDLMRQAPRRHFRLGWKELTAAELAVVLTAYTAAVTLTGGVVLETPDGERCTVNGGMTPGLQYEGRRRAQATVRYEVSLELWEA
jgi:hypothetical protein